MATTRNFGRGVHITMYTGYDENAAGPVSRNTGGSFGGSLMKQSRHHNSQTGKSNSKTPSGKGLGLLSTTKPRKAFGDISNRNKGQSISNNTNNAKDAKSVSFANAATKTPSSSKIVLPSKSGAKVRMPLHDKTPFKLEMSAGSGSSTKPAALSVAAPTSVPKKRVDFTLPKPASTLKPKSGEAPVLDSKPNFLPYNDLDASFGGEEIELSAGRLWVEQQDYDNLKDDGSIMPLKGALITQETMQAIAKERHETKMKFFEEERQRDLQELDDYVSKVLYEDDEWDLAPTMDILDGLEKLDLGILENNDSDEDSYACLVNNISF